MRLKKNVKYTLAVVMVFCIIGIIILTTHNKNIDTNTSKKDNNVQVSDSTIDNQTLSEDDEDKKDIETENGEEDSGLQVVDGIQLDSGDPEKTEEIGG